MISMRKCVYLTALRNRLKPLSFAATTLSYFYIKMSISSIYILHFVSRNYQLIKSSQNFCLGFRTTSKVKYILGLMQTFCFREIYKTWMQKSCFKKLCLKLSNNVYRYVEKQDFFSSYTSSLRSSLCALRCARAPLTLLLRCSSLFCWMRASSLEIVPIPNIESFIP